MRRRVPSLPWVPPSGGMRPSALQLATSLCEALRGEDDTMVEALLLRGANPSSVLPEGIAPIHLAAGMEQECGIRCLRLILQYGGDPNVRSVDDLTPLHVAASWGCYTCLRLLLMEGGNPRLEDQDGNTALDLALEQGNETCVRILQRSLEETGEEQSNCMSHRRAESFLSTVTEDLLGTGGVSRFYDPSPGRLSRTPQPSLNETLRRVGPCASSSRPVAPDPNCTLPGNCQDKTHSFEDRSSASFLSECSWRFSTLSEQRDLRCQPAASSHPFFLCGDAVRRASNCSPIRGCPDDGPVCPRSTANSAIRSHYVETTTNGDHWLSPDRNGVLHTNLIGSVNCTSRVYPEIPSATGCQETPECQSCALKSECEADHLLDVPDTNTPLNCSQYSSFLDPDLVVKLTSQEGLDVTSPDHVYLFSRGNSTAMSDLEKTIVDPASRKSCCSSGRYTLCNSECYVSATEAPCYSEAQEATSAFGCFPGPLDSVRNNNSRAPMWSSEERIEPLGAVNARVCPASSESLGQLPDGTGFRETSSRTFPGGQALAPCSTGKNEHSGNPKEPGSPRMPPNGVLVTRPSPKWENQDLNALLLQESQECRMSGAQDMVLPEGSSDVAGGRVATGELRGEFTGTMVSPEALSEWTEGEGRRAVRESPPSSNAQAAQEGRESLWAPDTELLPRASEETESFLGRESPVSPETCRDADGARPGPQPTADGTMPVLHPTVDGTVTAPHPTASVEGEESTSLEAKLREMMFATKVCHSPLLQPDSRPSHVTPRSKSRTTTSATHDSSVSSSLFDDTLEMPRRPRRVRSPEGRTPTSSEAWNWTNGLRQGDPPSVAGVEADELDDTQFISAGPSTDKPAGSPGCGLPGPSIASPAGLTNLGRDVPRGDGCSDVKLSADHADLQEGKRSASTGDGGSTSQETGDAVVSGIDPERSGTQRDKVERLPKPSRVSFSRMSARGQPFAPGTCGRLSPISQGVPLSPGGRPVNRSATEPVEYLYVDEDEGHSLIERHVPCSDDSVAGTTSSEDTIIYDWRAYTGQAAGQVNAPAQSTSGLCRLSDEALFRKLRDFGVSPGPVTGLTRKIYLQLLEKLMNDPKTKARKGSAGFSPELASALETYQIPDGREDEMALAREFDQPDKGKRWREGLLKSSFNYLLLDPRVTQNLPFRCQFVSQAECFRTFVSAIFYVGKGKRSRPYSHLYEALTRYKDCRGRRGGQVCSKVQHILEIWASGQGVISMHCFQNVIPVEAYTREACMLDAIGLKMLTNQKRGNYYGVMAGWPMKRRRCLGAYLLHRALQIFLAEGERQLRPADIQTGQ